MKLYDDGRLDIDDPISKYISSFKNMRVVNDRRYPFPPKNPINSLLGLITYTPDKAKTEAANRELTFRDLLSHSSGIEQGIGGYAMHFKDKELLLKGKQKNMLQDRWIFSRVQAPDIHRLQILIFLQDLLK